METPTDRSQTPQGETGSPRWTERVVHRTAPPGTLPCLEAEVMLLGDAHGSTDPADITCPQCKGPTRSPHAAGEPAICDPGYHVSGPWCSRCGQWFVDGEWRNTPPETTRSPRAPESAFGCLCATDPDGCPIHRHYPAEVHSDDVMLSAVVSEGITPLTPVAEEIRVVLNRYSAEAPSGTPDYILANYLIDCLKAFNEAVSLRAVWRGEPIEQMVRHIDKER